MAAVDYFLKLEGIPGESKADKHTDEIDVQSYSWGGTQSGTFATGGGGGAGKVAMQDFHFTKLHSKASPALMLAMAQGDHIPSAILTCRKAGKEQQEFLTITLSDCIISSYQSGGSAGASVIPTDQVSINFAKIEHEYKEQDATGALAGSVKKTFDLKSVKGS
jgi:type VI secretion system secreted protein Hcp